MRRTVLGSLVRTSVGVTRRPTLLSADVVRCWDDDPADAAPPLGFLSAAQISIVAATHNALAAMTTELHASTPGASSGPTDADLAAAAASSPARVVAEPLPLEMRYTSLHWLGQDAGVPLLTEETPPTSPIKARRSGSSSISSIAGESKETETERRQRQEAFIAEKNRQLQLLKEKGTAADISDEESTAADAAPQTPVRKPKPSASASAASATSPSPASSSAAAPFVSPEKRRAKKLSSLQYPIFSVYWWDFPPAALRTGGEAADSSSSEATDPSSRAIAKAAATSAAAAKQDEPSMGLVLLGGGGGKKGAGIDSGMVRLDKQVDAHARSRSLLCAR